MNLVFGITAHNEHLELNTLLEMLFNFFNLDTTSSGYLGQEVKILIQLDVTATEEVREIVEHWNNKFGEIDFSFQTIEFPLRGNDGVDFAQFKNNLFKHCEIGSWCFQLDSDEFPTKLLLENIPRFIEQGDENGVDLIRLSRVNIVNGITMEHVNRWGWALFPLSKKQIEFVNTIVDSNVTHIVNWPDLQSRIYKNTGNLKWHGKVHETIIEYKYEYRIVDVRCSLFHVKNISRQIQQNELYSKIQ